MRRNPASRDDLVKTLLVAADAAEELGQVGLAAGIRLLAATQRVEGPDARIVHAEVFGVCSVCKTGKNVYDLTCAGCGTIWPVCSSCLNLNLRGSGGGVGSDVGVEHCPHCLGYFPGPLYRAFQHDPNIAPVGAPHFFGNDYERVYYQVGEDRNGRFHYQVWFNNRVTGLIEVIATEGWDSGLRNDALRQARIEARRWAEEHGIPLNFGGVVRET